MRIDLKTFRRIAGVLSMLCMSVTPILYWVESQTATQSTPTAESHTVSPQSEESSPENTLTPPMPAAEEEAYSIGMHLITFITAIVTLFAYIGSSVMEHKRQRNESLSQELDLELKRLQLEEKKRALSQRNTTALADEKPS